MKIKTATLFGAVAIMLSACISEDTSAFCVYVENESTHDVSVVLSHKDQTIKVPCHTKQRIIRDEHIGGADFFPAHDWRLQKGITVLFDDSIQLIHSMNTDSTGRLFFLPEEHNMYSLESYKKVSYEKKRLPEEEYTYTFTDEDYQRAMSFLQP